MNKITINGNSMTISDDEVTLILQALATARVSLDYDGAMSLHSELLALGKPDDQDGE